MVLLNVVNTTGQYILNRLIVGEAAVRFGSGASGMVASRQFITAYSGSIMAAVNLVGLLLQLFLTSRVIRWIGIRGSLFVLPVIALVNYSIMALVPLLAVVRIGKVLENSTDYSLQNTLRQALFLPTSRDANKSQGSHRHLLHEDGRCAFSGCRCPGSRVGTDGLDVRRVERRHDAV